MLNSRVDMLEHSDRSGFVLCVLDLRYQSCLNVLCQTISDQST